LSDQAYGGPLVIGTPVAAFEPRPPLPGAHRPDFAADGWGTGRFTVRAASVRGYQHRHDGKPRQDDFAVACHPGSGAVVTAVADGVSSVDLAHVGATLACRNLVDQLLRQLDEDPSAAPDWAELMRCAGWALVEFAAAQPEAAPEETAAARAERLLATTLVAAVVRPRSGGAVAEVAGVGDSAAWLLRAGAWTALLGEQDGEILTPAVAALPRVPAEVPASSVELDHGDVLLLGTDGIGGALGDGSGLVGAAFAAGLAAPPAPLDLAHLLDFSRETFDDDRTLVAVWPREAEGERT
jgi:serine/threonine protein phosphatase PrpC